jgi:SAM-dependent methyltransferase
VVGEPHAIPAPVVEPAGEVKHFINWVFDIRPHRKLHVLNRSVGSVSGDLSRRLWEEHAEWWIDGFTDGADPEYEDQIIPLVVQELAGVETVLDVGTGDGQIARALSATGCEVTGVDPTSAQISVAVERGGGPRYVQSGACPLPFDDESFDAALACLVFEHIDDVDGAISEVARVLRPGGSFNFLLNHPLLQTPDSGWIDDHMVEPPEQYWRIGNYLDEAETIEQVESGVHIRFLHRPLSRYLNALADNGLLLERMDEPAPPDRFLAQAPEYFEAASVPRLLHLRLRKVVN